MSTITKNIDRALVDYHLLSRVVEDGFIRVKGFIPLIHPKIGEIDRYEVLIKFPKDYPKCFPKVIETSNKIPRIPNRHVNPDNTLCLAVEPEEKALTKNGISFKYFLDRILIPHLARETYRESKGVYPDGEYAHGYDGIWEYYKSILKESDKLTIIRELEQIVNSNWPERNQKCFCGSGNKFKKCHLDSWTEILKSGKDYIKKQIQILKTTITNE
ncbi:MAG: hypothetical protein Wins2KO_31970 [Winogradskyella sp.]